MGVGRPTKYKESYCQEILDYFGVPPNYEREITITNKSGAEYTKYEVTPNNFPTMAGFACRIGVDRDTIQEWNKVHPAFSVAIKKAKEFQENHLVVNAMQGLTNPTFSIFVAKNVFGWKDKVELSGDEDAPVAITEIVINGVEAKD